MTASDQQTRPPDNPPPGPEWKKVTGYPGYEWSHRGHVRSVARDLVMKQRPNNSGYMVVNVINDEGVKETVLVHRMILRAHAGEFEPWEESLHGPGGQTDNRFPENLCKGTRWVNVAERAAANPAAPKPQTPCVNQCGRLAGKGGRRCPECIAELGRAAAALYVAGKDPDQVAAALSYSSPNGTYRHAVNHGGLRVYIDETVVVTGSEVTERHRESFTQRLRRVINRARASRQNSDGA